MSERGIPYVEYLYQALASNEGLVLTSTDPSYVIRQLKEAKIKSLEEQFTCLEIIPSPTTPSEIWILKNAEPSTGESNSQLV